ncbi:MAG: hypothetical protein ACI9RO_001059 [Alteromonas macleodii]|jgi:hypothetical protein
MTSQTKEQGDLATTATIPGPLKLIKVMGTAFHRDYLLQDNDVVVAVNGKSWTKMKSIENTVKTALEWVTRPVLVTIVRDEKIFNVLVSKPFGKDVIVLLDDEVKPYQNLTVNLSIEEIRTLSNYVIVADYENLADIFEMRKTFLAMTFPPLWLIARRLWGPLVAFTCAILTSFSVNTTLGALMYLLMCVYVGQRQIPLVMMSMLRSGLNKKMVIAAHNEFEAQTIALKFHEKLRFKFSNIEPSKTKHLDVEII